MGWVGCVVGCLARLANRKVARLATILRDRPDRDTHRKEPDPESLIG